MSAPSISVSVAASNGKPQRIVEARAGNVIHRDTFDPNSATSRRRFIRALANTLGVDTDELAAVDAQIVAEADAIDAAVEAAAAEAVRDETASTSTTSATYPEIDNSRIVRPERFIAPAASGLSVPVLSEVEGRIVGRWLLYLRHADGTRECRALKGNVEMPDGNRLFVHPSPNEPTGSSFCGWSAEARKKWLDGAPVTDPALLFSKLHKRIGDFIDFSADRSAGTISILALWTILTYLYHAWPAVPYLFVGGPLGSGKSRVFEVLSRLVFRPLLSSNLTAPALFRTLHERGGTLLLDEAERLRRGNDPGTGDLVSMLLAGYKRGGRATRLEPVGESFKTCEFDVFGPKALACIEGLPPALASRCISIFMFRAKVGSRQARTQIDAHSAGWQSIRDDLHAIALEYGTTWLDLVKRADVCPEMSGRDFELWQPILALAAWGESHGACGLTEQVESHALSAIETNRDEQHEIDQLLLTIMANSLRQSTWITPGSILSQAMQFEPEIFRSWGPRRVSDHLKRYGLRTTKSHGSRNYTVAHVGTLRKIQQNYGLDLGFE